MAALRDPVPPWERPGSSAPGTAPASERGLFGRARGSSAPERRTPGHSPSSAERSAVRTVQWIATVVSAAVALLAVVRLVIAMMPLRYSDLLSSLPALWPVPMIAMAVTVVALGVAHGVAGRWTDGTSARLTFTLVGTVLAPMTLLAAIVFSIDDLNYHQLMGAELAEWLAVVIAGAVAAGPALLGTALLVIGSARTPRRC
ncbi:hypothetical protein M3F63_00650 [Brachybacterium muris]|uniref:hypothetical protein n=1 Tax=Brachybacterium muris TaxID=219301 RepID=UPI00223AB366|nr:hypothetical protein [Brachybacterium muris]MCT2176187.1 hypothetical protein [Brachybacterium muris]